ncbi:MAG: FecR family protein [Candidatus Omnitrophica bacterium]|nr:FecR family protein [Candidatus Omnitrophota bacterium]
MKKAFFAFTIIALLVILVAIPSWCQIAAQTVTLTNVKGIVLIQKLGATQWNPASDGMQLTMGDAVKTGKDGSVKIEFKDGGTLTLQKETDIKVLRAEEKEKTTQTEVDMKIGKLRAQIQKLKAGSKFDVKTPVSVATVRGTTYDLFVYESNGQIYADMNVVSGDVWWSNMDNSMGYTVGEGQGSTANQTGQITEPQGSPENADQNMGGGTTGGGGDNQFNQSTTSDQEQIGGQQGYSQDTYGSQNSASGSPIETHDSHCDGGGT